MLSSSGSVRHGSRRSTPPARRRREPAGRVASRMPARRSGGSAWLSARVRARDRLARGLPPLSVVLSAVCARVRACVFSTDVGGPERERAGQGCYPGVRAAGRGGGGSQALRRQGIHRPRSRCTAFRTILGRSRTVFTAAFTVSPGGSAGGPRVCGRLGNAVRKPRKRCGVALGHSLKV